MNRICGLTRDKIEENVGIGEMLDMEPVTW